MKKNNNQSGLTLISILIASSILVILSTYISMIIFDLAQFDLRSQSDQYITSNSRFIISKLKYNIRRADSVSYPLVGESGNVLELKVGEETVSYYLEDGTLVQEDGQGMAAVSSNLVKIDSFEVTLIDNPNSDSDLPALETDLDVVWLGELREGQKQNFNINSTIGLRKNNND